jgi:hypothetical protein
MDNANAGQEPVKKPDEEVKTPVASEATGVDYEAELAKTNAELARVRLERENYRLGMLKAKGKLPDDGSNGDDVSDMDALIDQKIAERLASSTEARIQMEQTALIAKIAKENKELKVALQNKSQVATAPAGGSGEGSSVKDSFFTGDQIRNLEAQAKAIGVDPVKFIASTKENMQKMGMTASTTIPAPQV